MKPVLCSLVLWSLCSLAPAADVVADAAKLKTFSSIGKELTVFTKKHTFSACRFHDDDPIFFQKGLRLTCRCGEEMDGKVFHDPPDTRFTTYAWVYQW